MENRNGLLVGVDVRHATGTGERDGALALVDAHLAAGATLGADKGLTTPAPLFSTQYRPNRFQMAAITKVTPAPKNVINVPNDVEHPNDLIPPP